MQRESIVSPWTRLPIFDSSESPLEPGSAKRRLSLRSTNTVTPKPDTSRRRFSLCSDVVSTPKLAPAGSAPKLTGKENYAVFNGAHRSQASRCQLDSPSLSTTAGILAIRNSTDSKKKRVSDNSAKTLKRTYSPTDFDFERRDDFNADSRTGSKKKTEKGTPFDLDKSAKRRLSGDFHDAFENVCQTDEHASSSIARKAIHPEKKEDLRGSQEIDPQNPNTFQGSRFSIYDDGENIDSNVPQYIDEVIPFDADERHVKSEEETKGTVKVPGLPQKQAGEEFKKSFSSNIKKRRRYSYEMKVESYADGNQPEVAPRPGHDTGASDCFGESMVDGPNIDRMKHTMKDSESLGNIEARGSDVTEYEKISSTNESKEPVVGKIKLKPHAPICQPESPKKCSESYTSPVVIERKEITDEDAEFPIVIGERDESTAKSTRNLELAIQAMKPTIKSRAKVVPLKRRMIELKKSVDKTGECNVGRKNVGDEIRLDILASVNRNQNTIEEIGEVHPSTGAIKKTIDYTGKNIRKTIDNNSRSRITVLTRMSKASEDSTGEEVLANGYQTERESLPGNRTSSGKEDPDEISKNVDAENNRTSQISDDALVSVEKETTRKKISQYENHDIDDEIKGLEKSSIDGCPEDIESRSTHSNLIGTKEGGVMKNRRGSKLDKNLIFTRTGFEIKSPTDSSYKRSVSTDSCAGEAKDSGASRIDSLEGRLGSKNRRDSLAARHQKRLTLEADSVDSDPITRALSLEKNKMGHLNPEESVCTPTDLDASFFSPKVATVVQNRRVKKCLLVKQNDIICGSLTRADVARIQKCAEKDPVKTSDIKARRLSIPSAQPETLPLSTTTPANGLQCPPMVPPFPKEMKVTRRRKSTVPLQYKNVVIHELPPEIQYTEEYIEDIVSFYAEKENSYKLSKNFPEYGTVCADQRRIVVNFMINIHAFLSKGTGVIYQAVKMFDAVLDTKKNVPLTEVQLIAIAAMWIAIKREACEIPSAKRMISLAKDMYHGNTDLLKACEQDILKTLNFNIAYADPLSLLAHHLWSIELYTDSMMTTVYYCASYLIDVSLLNEKLIRTPADLLAATAAATSLCLVNEEKTDLHNPEWSSWKLDSMSKYSQEELDDIRLAMMQGVLASALKGSTTAAVYKKYMLERYGKVSEFLVERVKRSTSSATIGHD